MRESRLSQLLPRAAYTLLVAELRALVDSGRERARDAVGRELVRTYHEVGKRIAKERLTGRGGYGKAMLRSLAEDLQIDLRTLQQAVLFASTYPKLPPEANRLRWAHYRELLRLPDAALRAQVEKEAVEHGWSRARLAEAIRERQRHGNKSKAAPRGATKIARPDDPVYVYKAQVERAVDGDTLLVLIDLGFQVFKQQRLRLASLDAPGLREPGGKEAQAFVRDALAAVDFVVIKTTKIDIYGRYVAHVFYGPGEADKTAVFTRGRYLNQELVDQGLARAL